MPNLHVPPVAADKVAGTTAGYQMSRLGMLRWLYHAYLAVCCHKMASVYEWLCISAASILEATCVRACAMALACASCVMTMICCWQLQPTCSFYKLLHLV